MAEQRESNQVETPPRISSKVPIEKLGPPGIRSELHILALFPDDQRSDRARLTDTTERKFTVRAQLSKFPPSSEEISGSFTSEDGTSYLSAPPNTSFFQIDTPQGQFIIRKNTSGELSFIKFSCLCTNANDARQKFLTGVMPLFDHLSYVGNIPIYIALLKIEDRSNDNQIIEYTGPYRKVVLNPHVGKLFDEMQPIYAMYHEAKRAQSEFYRFLCYYKIMEGLLGVLRSNVFQQAKAKGFRLPNIKEVVPNVPGVDVHRAYVGKRIKLFFDKVLTLQFRDAIAHFITDDQVILNMSHPENIYKYADIMLVTELCTRALISSHEAFLTALHQP